MLLHRQRKTCLTRGPDGYLPQSIMPRPCNHDKLHAQADERGDDSWELEGEGVNGKDLFA
jgi:hypothetical protein